MLALTMLLTLTACNQSITSPNPDDYREIYQMVKSVNNQSNSYSFFSGRSSNRDVLMESEDAGDAEESDNSINPQGSTNAPPPTESTSGDDNSDDSENKNYSDTNNQVEGVQESDIVKTDGSLIYIAQTNNHYYDYYYTDETQDNHGKVSIISADNGNMEIVSTIKLRNANPQEMLLYNGKLIIIWGKFERLQTLTPRNNSRDDRIVGGDYYYREDSETIVQIFDTDGKFEKAESTYSQKGRFNSSRMIDNNIYLITTFNPEPPRNFKEDDIDCYIPSYTVNDSEPRYFPADAIVLPEKLDRVEYSVIGGLDVNKSNMKISVKSTLGTAQTIYSSLENIYISHNTYKEVGRRSDYNHETHTVIDKFTLNKGKVEFKATGTVKGETHNQFHFDEHNGTLRVVTEVWGRSPTEPSKLPGTFTVLPIPKDKGWWDESWNNNQDLNSWGLQGGSLYTLDSDLNTLAEVHRIGFGESVHSVRLMGDIGYIVTFWQTDPLFSFDLSNPQKPVQLDELKIPGFSRYLHNWSGKLLLGIGVDTDDNGIRQGLKMTMFDVSDNEDLIERHVELINSGNNNWAYSPIENDHKAALVSPEKNIIGFPYSRSGRTNRAVYAIYSYSNRGFNLIGEITNNESDYYNYYNRGFQRGLFIGDYIYAIADNVVISARLQEDSIRQVQKLKL